MADFQYHGPRRLQTRVLQWEVHWWSVVSMGGLVSSLLSVEVPTGDLLDLT